MTKRTCSVPECSKVICARGLCTLHYQRQMKYGSVELPTRTKASELTCSVEGCETLAKGSNGWCHMHYRRWRLHGSTDLPAKAPIPSACSVEGCTKGGKLNRGWCATHYYRWRTHGDVQADIPIKDIGVLTECTVAGCHRDKNLKRGLCGMHYQRWTKHGDALWEPPQYPTTCSIEDCGKDVASKGLCGTHYARLIRTGTTDLRPPRELQDCSIDDCSQTEHTRGYCLTHYTRWKRHGDPNVLLRPWARAASDTCTVDGCGASHHAGGMCRPHWAADYHLKNRAQRNARMREHYLANREEYYAKTNRRRQRVEANMDALDRALSADRRRAIAKDPCAYCGGPSTQVDHYFPIAKGGIDYWWNLVRACEPCNKSKAAHCGTWFMLRVRLQ